jgi:opacity protein-like surface antigen
MASIRGSIALGVMMVALGSASAEAADLHNGSVKDGYIPAPTVVSEPVSSSLYFRIDGGHARYDDPIMVEDHIYDLVDTSISNTWSVGGGIGRHFGNGFRGDITYDYRFEGDAEGTLLNHAATLDGTRQFGLKSHVLMANLYYDFNAGGRFSPYLGVGLGWARNITTAGTVSEDCGCTGTIAGDTTNSVAAALMAGVNVKLRDRLSFDAGYRFLYLGDAATGPVTAVNFATGAPDVVSEDPVVENIHAHEFRFGLRYDIN